MANTFCIKKDRCAKLVEETAADEYKMMVRPNCFVSMFGLEGSLFIEPMKIAFVGLH